ncbi:MAG: FAD-linked oxidase C-terminal domain-containing protein, partial [Patescibacteria group bacterium]
KKAGDVVNKILPLKPSAFELVDKFLIQTLSATKPEMVKTVMAGRKEAPALVYFIEFEGETPEEVKNQANQAKKLLANLAVDLKEAYDPQEQDMLWQARRSAAIVAENAPGKKKSLPFIEDTVVPTDKLADYFIGLYKILQKYGTEFSVWGHAGNGNLHLQPFLDLSDPQDAEKVWKIAEEVYTLALSLGGALSAEHNDGLMRTPFLNRQFSEPMLKLFTQVKKVFDPQGIFNPHKKVGGSAEFSQSHMRSEYNLEIAHK